MIPESASAVREALARLGVRPRKRLGQNFLADANLRDAIVRDSGAGADDLVLEVGPGLGILTKGLLAAGSRVVAAEVDERLAGFLTTEFAGEPLLTIVVGDALERVALAPGVRGAIGALRPRAARWLVVSNLPYSAATPLLVALGRLADPPDRVVVMVQREVALRLTGAPGTADYGPLAVLFRLRGSTRILREVGGKVFVPPPPVRSAIVEFVPGSADLDAVLAGDRIARAAFLHRRKTIRKALVAAGYPPAEVEAAISEVGRDPTDRPQVLAPEEFVAIGRLLPPPRPA